MVTGTQAIDYLGLSGFRYRIDKDRWLNDTFNVELGSEFRLDENWRLLTEVGTMLGQNSVVGTGRITIGRQF